MPSRDVETLQAQRRFTTFEEYKREYFPEESEDRGEVNPREVALAQAARSLRRIALLLARNEQA